MATQAAVAAEWGSDMANGPDARDIKSAEDMRLWAVAHDARIDSWWEHQHEWNRNVDGKLTGLDVRVSGIERRIAWVAGFAAAAGGVIGALLPRLIGA